MNARQALQDLLDRQPRVRLGLFPTPLQRLARYGEQVGHHSLHIKRDDLTGMGMGGNKTRSLEFLLGHALQQGTDTIITAGGLQSNLCRLTAAACARLGLRCVLVHNDDAPATLEGNMLLNALAGAESHFVGPVSESERTRATEGTKRQVDRSGGRSYIIYNGASTPRGALGYVAAAAELLQQAEGLHLGLRHVVIVGAMGGTAAGLVAGTALLGHPFHVHVISVEYPVVQLRELLLELTDGIFELLKTVPPVDVQSVMTLHGDCLGGGYAVPSSESVDALLALARLEGIFVELVYTSKTLAGLAGLVERRVIGTDQPTCFWHTGGGPALFAQAPQLQQHLEGPWDR